MFRKISIFSNKNSNTNFNLVKINNRFYNSPRILLNPTSSSQPQPQGAITQTTNSPLPFLSIPTPRRLPFFGTKLDLLAAGSSPK